MGNLIYMNTKIILLHLSLIDGVGPITIKRILQAKLQNFGLLDLYTLKKSDFVKLFGLPENISLKLFLGLQDTSLLEKEVNLINKNKISFVTLENQNYPELLKNIYAPPAVLYFKGADILNHDKKIAFVGSRKANRYGQKVIESIVPQMIANGFVIVSGGAIGADSMAHEEAVNSGGKTVSVIGSGLLNPYPHSNKKLFEKIIDNCGTLLSPFALSTFAKPGNFPARNRVIAGLSLGCVVVQAAKKSGASITAQFALDQGRDVFAIPGSVEDGLSQGCHALIQQGAKLVANAEDILVEFGYCLAREEIEVKSKKTEKIVEKFSKILDISKSLQSINKSSSKYENGSIESIVLKCCKHPTSIDEIAAATSKDLQQMQEILFDMQLSGDIKQNHAGMFERA